MTEKCRQLNIMEINNIHQHNECDNTKMYCGLYYVGLQIAKTTLNTKNYLAVLGEFYHSNL